MPPRYCIAILWLMATCGGARAEAIVAPAPKPAPLWQDPGWRRTVARFAVTFEASGLDRKVADFEFRAVDDRGARAIAQQTFPYNSFFDDLTLSDLATVKADGRVIPIDDHAIRDQPASTNTASPYFDEQRIKIAAFANVEPGDRIRGRLTYLGKKPTFPGAYTGVWTQPLDAPPEVMDLTIDGPASMPLQVAARGVTDVVDRRGDRVIHHVSFRQEAPSPLLDATDSFDTARRFEVSTFKDYAAFAASMAARNAPMAAPDEALRRLSSEIVGDATTTRDKVERIHNWVAQNIRYVGIGFEDGGLTSQPASAVLASRYGDCKAHATILKALLSVQNIEADLVAVNAEPRYTLTSVATPGFDHAIAYVPALDIYLDPTAAWVAFGALPSSLYGKPVLNIDRGTIAQIPVLRPDEYEVGTDTRYTLRPNGTREAQSTLSGSGQGASLGRVYATYLETVDRAQVAGRALTAAGLSGTGTYKFANPRELTGGFAVDAPFTITKAIDLGRPAELRMLALTDPRPSIWTLISGGVTDTAFRCSSIDAREVASLELPEGTNVYEKPGDLADEESFIGDTAYGPVTGHLAVAGTVRVSGRIIRSATRITLAFDAPVCPATFTDQIRAGLAKADGFEHAAIGLTPKSVAYVVDSGSDAVTALAAFYAQDYAPALRLWSSLAESGNADAQNNIGWMYKRGKGVGQDFAEAFRWYLRSAAQGNALGQSNVAYFYSCGCGVVRSDAQAALWYRRSASQGFPYAEARLAEIMMAGRGVDKDPTQAVSWYEKAGSHDDLDAEKMLGTIYQGNFGIGADYGKAARWLRAAAERDDGAAQMSLGTLYADGHGVPHDDAVAVTWLRKAADKGLADAQYQLGWLYELGRGVIKDQAQATAWYMKADRQGHVGAHARLDAHAQAGSAAGSGGIWAGLLHTLMVFGRTP
jgi:TPR repeat protein/transglutaminase-like putative cysteine protease